MERAGKALPAAIGELTPDTVVDLWVRYVTDWRSGCRDRLAQRTARAAGAGRHRLGVRRCGVNWPGPGRAGPVRLAEDGPGATVLRGSSAAPWLRGARWFRGTP
ncbi:hypothetical protein FMEAI12_6280001 [Parafrankia sp. Ea1.12]|nr:hypothetical protein FMEAI12_6280001 [Parafrankia sp. Ea1.12]